MIKVLWYSDFLVPTGFGNVAEEILSRLLKTGKYKFTVIGINYDGTPYDIPDSPYYRLKGVPVHPAEFRGDMLGRQRLLNFLARADIDVLFALQDTFNMSHMDGPLRAVRAAKKWKYIYYFPVDGPLNKEWVDKAVCTADYPVVYTKFGLEEVRMHDESTKIPTIYHGVDRDVFYPMDPKERREFRKTFLKATDKNFVVTNVNRNTVRKDLPRTILAWRHLRQRLRRAKLYLHTDVSDPAGYDLERFIKLHIPPEMQDDISYPDPLFMRKFGMPKEAMRNIYGASDVVVSTSLGEGWGLSTTEAMACKVPVIMPMHTSSIEIVGDDEQRGWLAPCENHFVLQQHDNYQIRPLVSHYDLMCKMLEVSANPGIVEEKTEAAYTWVKRRCNWDEIAKQWDALFTRAHRQARSARQK
jgi:glycosyltransferase involved in cell wall biosynthesis